MSTASPIAASPARPPATGRDGRWFLVFIGLATAAIGLLFMWLLGSAYLAARESRAWPELPCVILLSEVEERRHDPHSPPEFRHRVLFGFEWQDEPMTGDRVSPRGSPWSSRRDQAAAHAAALEVGSETICHVPPAAPERAVLRPDTLAPGYTLWFPGLFVAGGLGVALRALLGMRGK